MGKQKFYRDFYEQAGIAYEHVSNEERTSVTLAMIPDCVNSVLDVGCGDGTLLDSLDPAMVKIGLDISYAVLNMIKNKGNRVQASSDFLPFRDGQFDLVLSTEVLEHLSSTIFEASRLEMQKLSKKYILISVPFQEDLAKNQTRCPGCGHIFHIHLHVRSFDMKNLEEIFPYYFLKSFKFSGPQEIIIPPWILNIRRKYGNRWEWDKNSLCPRCGYKNVQPPKRSIISAGTSILSNITGKRHPKWVSVLYERR